MERYSEVFEVVATDEVAHETQQVSLGASEAGLHVIRYQRATPGSSKLDEILGEIGGKVRVTFEVEEE
jgi:hypothetical protein